jgi:hypothetical protein
MPDAGSQFFVLIFDNNTCHLTPAEFIMLEHNAKEKGTFHSFFPLTHDGLNALLNILIDTDAVYITWQAEQAVGRGI